MATHRSSGLRIWRERTLAGDSVIFIDLQGNSLSSVELKNAESFAEWLRDVAHKVERWGPQPKRAKFSTHDELRS